jgi:hypothetical protein
MQATYAVELVEFRRDAAEATKGRVVWKASATAVGSPVLTSMAKRAERLADDFANRMKDDGFFPGCAKIAGPELPSANARAASAEYVPSSKLSVSGGLTVSALTYVPADVAAERARRSAGPNSPVNADAADGASGWRGEKFGPGSDQVTGLMQSRYSPSVAEYVRAALSAELHAMGINTADAQRTLRGSIEDAQILSARWGYSGTLRLRLELVDTASARVVYSAVKTVSTEANERPAGEVEAMNGLLRSTAEALARDEKFVNAIRGPARDP